MTTARFLVALTRAQDSSCRVERTVRRSDKNRAVFYVTNWLLQTQRLEHYFGVTYNVYEIYEQNEDGQWTQVEIGDTTNAEKRRTITGQKPQESKASTVDSKGRVRQGRTRGTPQPERDDPLFITDKLRGTAKFKRRGKTLSPFQQRVSAELELARQRLAEQKRKGES